MDSIVYNMPTVNAGGIYNHIFMGSKPKPLLQLKQMLHFFILDRFKHRDTTMCQKNFSCGIFPVEVTQRKVRRLACYVQCVFYSYYTGGWLQSPDDKISTGKKIPKNYFTSYIFYSFCQPSAFFFLRSKAFFFLHMPLQ